MVIDIKSASEYPENLIGMQGKDLFDAKTVGLEVGHGVIVSSAMFNKYLVSAEKQILSNLSDNYNYLIYPSIHVTSKPDLKLEGLYSSYLNTPKDKVLERVHSIWDEKFQSKKDIILNKKHISARDVEIAVAIIKRSTNELLHVCSEDLHGDKDYFLIEMLTDDVTNSYLLNKDSLEINEHVINDEPLNQYFLRKMQKINKEHLLEVELKLESYFEGYFDFDEELKLLKIIKAN